MKIILLALFTTLSPLAQAAGVISGGGLPKPIPMPSEDFAYACKVELSEQVGANYVAGEAELSIPKSKFEEFTVGGPTASLTTDASIAWKKSETSDSLPTHLNGHLIALSIRQNRDGTPAIQLYVRVLHENSTSYVWSDSSNTVPFASRDVSAETGSYDARKDRSGKTVSDLLLSLRVTCERTI